MRCKKRPRADRPGWLGTCQRQSRLAGSVQAMAYSCVNRARCAQLGWPFAANAASTGAHWGRPGWSPACWQDSRAADSAILHGRAPGPQAASWPCAGIHSLGGGGRHLATKLLPQPQLEAALGLALITNALRIRSDSKSTVGGRGVCRARRSTVWSTHAAADPFDAHTVNRKSGAHAVWAAQGWTGEGSCRQPRRQRWTAGVPPASGAVPCPHHATNGCTRRGTAEQRERGGGGARPSLTCGALEELERYVVAHHPHAPPLKQPAQRPGF